MILWSLVLIPFLAGIISYFIASDKIRRALWFLAVAVHLFLSFYLAFDGE